MTKREQALAIVDNYCAYHAGTALVVGTFGGQFGVDTVALTGLTIAMIEKICNVYGIHDRDAKNIHIASAIARLTYKGTVLAKTILHWLPLGSVANSATTYFLTRNAGRKCIEEIERGKMNVEGQLIQGLKDTAVVIVQSELCDSIESVSDHLSEDIIDNVKETLQCDVSKDLGLDSIITYLDNIPAEATTGIDKAIGVALRSTLAECMKGDARKIDSSEILRRTILSSLTAMIGEHTKMSEAEVHFRIMKNDEHYKTFESFFKSTAEYFDKIEQERDMYEAVKSCISCISDGCKLYFGLTSKDMLNSILDNPYDKAIEALYGIYLPMISMSDTYESSYAKAVILYYKLLAINLEYNVPKASLNKKDDKLIYMISGRIQECSELLKRRTIDEIAYGLSEFISKQSEYYSNTISMPVISINPRGWRKEYLRLRKSHYSFWIEIMKICHWERDVWSDGLVLYTQLLQLRQIFEGQVGEIYKDDSLIYEVADAIKQNVPLTEYYTTEQVAYFIAETYDKCIMQ